MATSATLSFGLAFEAGEKKYYAAAAARSENSRDGRLCHLARSVCGVNDCGQRLYSRSLAAAARLFAGVYPYRAVADSGHRPVVLYAELPRIGWILVNQRSAGQQRIWIVSGVLLLLQLLIIYAPFMQMLFGTTGLPFRYWVITFIIGFAMFLIVELENR